MEVENSFTFNACIVFNFMREHTIIHNQSFRLLPMFCYDEQCNYKYNGVYISLCICVCIPVERISRIKVARSKDMCNLNLWIVAKLFSKEVTAIYTSTYHVWEFLFPGCGFFNQQCWPILKGQPILQFYFQSTQNFDPFLYWCTKLLQWSLAHCQLSIRFSSPSPVLRWESLPRVKASCFYCFWQNHSLPVTESSCIIPFVRLYVPEMGRDYVLERLWVFFRVTQPWSPGFES